MIGPDRLRLAACAAVVVAFLTGVSTYYVPGRGLTAFIGFSVEAHPGEIARVREAPHVDDPISGGYDGQFYAQFAVDPLLRDPAIDAAMDSAPYRARRIFMAWVAWAAGLGRPAWILQSYSAINVVCWLVLAWLLTRWIDPRTPRGLALWTATLLSHGALASVRYALTDLPATLLLALAVLALERGRPFAAAIVLGLAGLTRETMAIGATMFASVLRRRAGAWTVAGACVAVAALPLALWIDYLRSIYRSLAFAGGGHITMPFAGLWIKLQMTASGWAAAPTYATIASTLALVGIATQSAIVLRGVWRRGPNVGPAFGPPVSDRTPPEIIWALAALPFVLLAIVSHEVIWGGSPGAFTRVFLPLTIGANVLLARRAAASWLAIVAANLGVVPGVLLFWLGWA